jgi:hypothetical protein
MNASNYTGSFKNYYTHKLKRSVDFQLCYRKKNGFKAVKTNKEIHLLTLSKSGTDKKIRSIKLRHLNIQCLRSLDCTDNNYLGRQKNYFNKQKYEFVISDTDAFSDACAQCVAADTANDE